MKKEQNEYKFLKKHLNKRRIELGVGKRGELKEGEHETLMYPFGEYEKIQEKFEDRSGIELIELVDFAEFEESDYESLKATFAKYSRLWSNIFTVYSNRINTFEKRSDFDKICSQLGRISIPEFYKFIKEYKFDDKINQLEIKTLFKLIST